MVEPSAGVVENMKYHKEVDDPTIQMQEYMKHNAEFRRRLISVRESRALLEKTQRMRKERASHMGFQFKQILWQMRRAQDDAYLAQERYLKLLQLDSGHALRYHEGSARVQDKQDKSLHFTQVAQQNGCQANQNTSHQNEHQNQNPPCVNYNCAEDVADLDLIQGTSFRFFTAIEENNDSTGKNNCDAQETQSYLTPINNGVETSREETLQESTGELELITPTKLLNVCERDDFVSTSLFVCGNLDSHAFLLEQRQKATNLVNGGNKVVEGQLPTVPHCDKKQDQGQGISWVQGSTDEGNEMNSEFDLPVSTMPITVLHHDQKQDQSQELAWVEQSTDDGKKMKNSELDTPVSIMSIMPVTPTAEEVAKRDVEKKRCEEARNPFLKIQKSDFLSQKIANELEEFTRKSSVGFCASKPTNGSGHSWIKRVGGACEVESTAEKDGVKGSGEIIKSKIPHGLVEKSGLTSEEKRNIMEAWHPEEKLAVLGTITNTMFLWKVEQSSSEQQHYGSWQNSELFLLSAAHAAKVSQRELFELLETIGDDMSRPLICCGAVCELLKAYPPEKLLPSRFLEDFLVSESREANLQCISGRPVDGLSFDHLEVYQEGEHTKFWQMLVHHVVCVKDHNLASLEQIAHVVTEVLLPSTRTEDFPAKKALDLQQDLLQFLVRGFRSKILHVFRVNCEDDKCAVSQKRLQHISKNLEGKHSSLGKNTTENRSLYQQTTEFSKGYKLRRSSPLGPVSTRKGLLSCFGWRVRTKFRIWRLKALSRGVDTVDDALVSLLRRNG